MPQAPFLALITPLSSPTEPPPGPGTSPGVPTHPIYLPPGPVDPGYSPPWATPRPPYVDNTLPRPPGVPTHPIYNPAYPDNTLPTPRPPGVPTHPIYYPPYIDNTLPIPPPVPSHPIYIPPEGSPPPLGIWGPPQMPPGFWGGGMGPGVKPQPHPEHPIVIPPDLPPTTPEGGKIEWKTAWTPQTGWIVVGIPAEGTLVPTPSK